MAAFDSANPALHARLVDNLYVEAMVMADEARSYFDRQGEDRRVSVDMMTRLTFTCESLKVTTRLMHIIAWLLTQRAWQRGEIAEDALRDPRYRLGEAAATDAAVVAQMPPTARELVESSMSLYRRVKRLQDQMLEARAAIPETAVAASTGSPALSLIDRLEKSF